MNLSDRRRFYAEEIEATAHLRSQRLVDALATVPREHFLPPGPWTVRGEADFHARPRQTPDADPRHVYHNFAVAIDAARQLFNGMPGLLAMAIDALGLEPGNRVLHIGAGTGYYTALIATCVGGSGHVAAIEADAALSAAARRNLAAMPWVDVRHGDGMARSDEPFDAVLVNAGVTHPHERWLDALVDGGRIVVPLTVAMGQTIGKGPLFLLTRASNDSFDARLLTLVTIYSSVSGRDPAIEQELGARMKANPFGFMSVARFRRDAHPISPSCWVHTPTGCFAACE